MLAIYWCVCICIYTQLHRHAHVYVRTQLHVLVCRLCTSMHICVFLWAAVTNQLIQSAYILCSLISRPCESQSQHSSGTCVQVCRHEVHSMIHAFHVISLFICYPQVHLLGEERGPVLEVIVSRMRHISAQTGRHIRYMHAHTCT